MLDNSPDKQKEIALNPLKCFTDDSLTLGELRGRFGDNAPIAWLMPQLNVLSEFFAVKIKLEDEILRECAEVIASKFYYLKTSELMLFFYWCKCGTIKIEFYGSIDPSKITKGLNAFVQIRNHELDRIEAEERERKREAERKLCVSREEYLKNWKDKI